jgi:hypothetical protein
MEQRDYLDGNLYHMVHFANLKSIFRRRALLSKERVQQEGISYHSIAYEEVQKRRDRIFIWTQSESRFRPLHSYVPFYFTTFTPMLYVQRLNDIQHDILIFEVSRAILRDTGVIFTDGNATNQQLSNKGETVYITPAANLGDPCRRRYNPVDAPYGTNANRSDFYCDLACLELLNWDIINDRRFSGEERKRMKHAEVLVPDLLPIQEIQGIVVNNQKLLRDVNALIDDFGLLGHIPYATFEPQLFFQ